MPHRNKGGSMLAWIGLAVQTSLLAAEAQSVIALRLAEIATGRGSLAESQLMVTEKVLALAEVAALVATGGTADAVVRGYRRKVRSNAKRLRRKGRSRRQ